MAIDTEKAMITSLERSGSERERLYPIAAIDFLDAVNAERLKCW